MTVWQRWKIAVRILGYDKKMNVPLRHTNRNYAEQDKQGQQVGSLMLNTFYRLNWQMFPGLRRRNQMT